MLVLALVIFGPLDVLRYAWQLAQDADATQNLATLPAHWLGDFVFPPVSAFGFFIGNYLPNTFQLFWSPQQIIAGWIGVAMLTHLVQQQQWRMLFFIYSLLSLWAPMVMLATAPLGLASLIIARKSLAQLVQLDTLVGAGMLFIIVGLYYAGGNIGHNLNFWLLARLTPGGYCALLVFHLAGWGLYTLSTLPFLRTQAHAIRVWFVGLVSSLALLPLHIFGAWSDLLCRGSAPLMFLLLVYLLQALRFYWLQRCHRLLLASVVLMALGSLTSAWMLGSSLKHYGQTQPVGSITWYGFPEENFGPDQSWFNDYLRKPAPPPPLAPP